MAGRGAASLPSYSLVTYWRSFHVFQRSICARLSGDGGRTWGEEVVLRDGGGEDLGYPRSVQRSDGKVLTVYYFWDERTGPECYIAAPIWDARAATPAAPVGTKR
jgi:hypothetical protein